MVVSRGTSRHHRCIGKEGSRLERPAIRWSLKVPMECSALLVRCKWAEPNEKQYCWTGNVDLVR